MRWVCNLLFPHDKVRLNILVRELMAAGGKVFDVFYRLPFVSCLV